MPGKQILVTGGAGFLGSHLCERLLTMGNEVLCVDNFYTGTKRNVAHLLDNPYFELLRHDITLPLFVEVDEIYNLACPASPVHYQHDPVQTTKVSVHGAINMLGLAKRVKAPILQASTSEVYGDPEVHPQREDYWGNVNPIGVRSCYDEGKRCAETLFFDYHRQHGLSIKVARIFNSVLADEPVVVFNDAHLHLEAIGEYAQRVELSLERERHVLVPAFDPQTLRMELRPATALIKHPSVSDAFELRLRYGRSVKVTGDHSVFVEGPDGRPMAKPVRNIRVGDHVAIPGRIPVVERDRTIVDLSQEGSADGPHVWELALFHPSIPVLIEQHRAAIDEFLQSVFAESIPLPATISECIQGAKLPVPVVRSLRLRLPDDARFGTLVANRPTLPRRVVLTPDVLWLLGLYLAVGAGATSEGVQFVASSSNIDCLERATAILRGTFGISPELANHGEGAASLHAPCPALDYLFHGVLGFHRNSSDRRMPAWVMQLPRERVIHLLDGYHSGAGPERTELNGSTLGFTAESAELGLDLNYLLLRFGLVATVTFGQSTSVEDREPYRAPRCQLTLGGLDNHNILTWDQSVGQTLGARRTGDLVWSEVLEVRPCLLTPYVYDFSVPESENFVAGSGVCCHNTYGPRMQPNDGRVVSNFIIQALRNEPITIYGDGNQTRSFCFVDDLVDGLIALMSSRQGFTGPVNLGNPREFTIAELASSIIALTGSKSSIVTRPLPADDPRRRRPDISLANRELGWQPRVGLEEGLRKTIEYFRNLLSSEQGTTR